MGEDGHSVVRDVAIVNAEGFHTRPVMKFVDLAQRFSSDIRVISLDNEDEVVNGKSAMELMLLAATKGTRIRVEGVGDDAERAVDALARLVSNGFDLDGTGDAA